MRARAEKDDCSASASKNKFVHLALQRTLALALELKGASHVHRKVTRGLDIVIVGDNDFYSQRAQVRPT
jgi:phosphomevalonate kinase